MTVPAIADCAGLWRRTLLVEADGSHHTEPGVRWLQGITAYVDSRGFAGSLHQRADVFEWQRDVDLEPPGEFPDAGSMHWDGNVLVETGLHVDYAEHWVRDPDSAGECGAVFLSTPDGTAGLLLRVGHQFGWAGAGAVVIGPVGGPEWVELAIKLSDNEVRANNTVWNIERSEGTVHS
ncbi:hypothetical protein [Mycolicibacterium hodleri]|uniref:Uncharacterized protein n=1 Tax=Mycolicibacterium hodleri TaxID=49897 RepID=A0A502EJV1_9MYCO|nr:hypothetical protein [Mycolicibacterium hodleri]TPG36790.1 hypothetical protein EAH80_02380 [Mycolicibacterium hodleri]